MHLLTHSIILKTLGWWLFNSIWQMGLLWLLYCSFSLICRQASASARHGLALFLLAIGVCWSVFSFAKYFITGGVPETSLDGILPGEGSPFYPFLAGGHRIIEYISPWCSSIYLVTLSILFIRYARQYFYTRQLRQTGLSRVSPELRLFTARTSRQIGIRREVRIWLSALVEAPVTLGLFKPVILLPLTTVTQLTPAQLEAVLLHELTHIRQFDYLLNLGISALEVIFFFNPFARLLIRRIKKEREHRCDDVVLQFRYDPQTYASALLSLATLGEDRHPRLMLAATGGNDQLLLHRVRRILKVKNTREKQTARPVLFLLFPLMAALLALNFSHRTVYLLDSSEPATMATSGRLLSFAIASAVPNHSSVSITVTESSGNQPSGNQGAGTIIVETPVNTHGKNATAVPTAVYRLVGVPAGKPAPHVTHNARTGAPITMFRVAKDPIILVANDQSDEDNNNNGNDQIVMTSQETPPSAGETADNYIQDYTQGSSEDVIAAVQTASRDFSISTTGTAITTKNIALRIHRMKKTESCVYVPNASFVYCSTACDTTHPEIQYAYQQQKAIKQMNAALVKVYKDQQMQLKIMQQAQSQKDQQLIRKQNQILQQQVKLQQAYLEKQRDLQIQLEKTVNKRVIVVI